MTRLERLLNIALMLSARRRLRAKDLSETFCVSLRTIYRDISSLQVSGFPIVGTAGDGYRLPSETRLRPIALDPDEALVLAMGAQLLDAIVDHSLKGRLKSAMAKLEAVLSPEAVQSVSDIHERLRIEPHSRITGPLALLLDAVNSQRVISMTYDGIARGLETKREIEPLGLVRYANVWLLPAFCRLRQELRTFRSDRITQIHLTTETFHIRPDHSFQDYIAMCKKEVDASSQKNS
ncbi:MAG: WYL domain-containing protein [Nitrospirota bacterium]|nr:WYL domain-containing protein [Nitrospirota bacterium]